MKQVKRKPVSEIAQIVMGQSPSSDSYNESGEGVPFFQGKADFGDVYPKKRVYCTAPQKMAEAGDILMSVRAPIGDVNLAREKCCIGRGLAAIRANDDMDAKYLFYVLQHYKDRLAYLGTGTTFKAISREILREFVIPICDVTQQKKIADFLDTLHGLIKNRQRVLTLLDELVRSRFVEMFGDPQSPDNNNKKYAMTEICTIIDGDRGKQYPKAEDFSETGYCLFLNAKNVTASGFNFDSQMFISREKDMQLRKGKLSRGDVVLTTRGTIGNIAIYDENVPFENVRINSGMVILRMDANFLIRDFFVQQFRMNLPSILEQIASGTAQPQLPISSMNRIEMIVPPMKLQTQFATFVHQVDATKKSVQAQLDSLTTLRAKMMQDFLG